MKKNERNDLKKKTSDQLNKILAELKKDIAKEHVLVKMGKVKNVHFILGKRQDVARIKTILAQSALSEKKEEGK